MSLRIVKAGPATTVQDLGRPGFLAEGLSRGGAADPLALAEGAALLGNAPDAAALEFVGFGADIEATEDTRIALTGAPMRASLDASPLRWPASYLLPAGARLSIGPAVSGAYGYLHVGGGVQAPQRLGARGAHLVAGLGAPLADGDEVDIGPDPGGPVGLTLDVEDRFSGGLLRLVPSVQTDLFSVEERQRFAATTFTRDLRANRMGVRLTQSGPGFRAETQLTILSEVIVPGDVQITGDGTPFVLLPECQTTGGYPRIGTVIPADMPRIAQAPAGAALSFEFLTLHEALDVHRRFVAERDALPDRCRPLVRDPRDIPDLLAYQLIGGAISAHDA